VREIQRFCSRQSFIDDRHREDVIDGHGAGGCQVEDSIEGEALLERASGHRDLKEILECMLGNCKADHSGVDSFSNGIHCERIVVVSSKDIGLVGP
jgi:hypothetical protein